VEAAINLGLGRQIVSPPSFIPVKIAPIPHLQGDSRGMDSRQQVKQFFSRYVEGFDAHYDEKSGGCDRVLRKSMFLRQSLTIELLGDVAGRRILDVGIGGRLAMALLRGGAQVTKLDLRAADAGAGAETGRTSWVSASGWSWWRRNSWMPN
jgi:2-polyprenyl-3-methyl-5-hydroxy-6-metoxy-1,4-benzoquinol methylase